MHWFVTGTDTGVGKTDVSVALLGHARSRGWRTAGMKPVETGCAWDGATWRGADAERLADAATERLPMEVVCPFRFALPAAPSVAARSRDGTWAGLDGETEVEGASAMARGVSVEGIRRAFEAIAATGADVVLVEGAGGLRVPVTEEHDMADLALALGLPVLVVARDGLGTINHTALTVDAARARGLELAGVVLNGVLPGTDPLAVDSNAAEIERLTGCPVLGIRSHGGAWRRPFRWPQE
ncbi:MAG: dethiobiotin synthase [Deltaproteobacteria bacterium]|nr:MAG: dethiobiotin synthase [Deltaproteobacteria bacterium]